MVWGGALATTQSRRAYVPNHCGFGVVEEIGPDVKRVQVGDRVIVAYEEYCVPVFTDLPAAELTLLGDQDVSSR